MTIKKEYEYYKITNDKYKIYLRINYTKNSYDIFNQDGCKVFEFGGIKINRHRKVLSMIYYAVNFSIKKLQGVKLNDKTS